MKRLLRLFAWFRASDAERAMNERKREQRGKAELRSGYGTRRWRGRS